MRSLFSAGAQRMPIAHSTESLMQCRPAFQPYDARCRNGDVKRISNIRKSRVKVDAIQEENVIDQDFLEELNRVSNRTLEVLSSCQEAEAQGLSSELREMQTILEDIGDQQSISFLRVLQGFLNHKLPKDINSLGGMYSRAADRILNQVAGSEWELLEEGQTKDQQEPKFSTWDDVINGKKQKAEGSSSGSIKDDTYYRLLRVGTSADPAEIKQAFRRLALKLHPDVNSAADAGERFSEVSNAYDILSDPTSRELYDLHGLDANRQIGSEAGKGNAREAWDEFKPFKKENKRTKARDSVRTQSSAGADVPTSGASEPRCEDPNERCGLESASSTGVGQSICSFPTPAPPQFAGKRLLEWHGYILAIKPLVELNRLAFSEHWLPCSQPQIGDIVEYPLRSVETEDFNDGRTHGVGLLVGRNMDRGDATKLPTEQLDLCEIESLRQENADSNRWIADDLGIPSFARLSELTIVPVNDFDKRFSVWTIDSQLSPGCGGPPLPEEIIL